MNGQAGKSMETWIYKNSGQVGGYTEVEVKDRRLNGEMEEVRRAGDDMTFHLTLVAKRLFLKYPTPTAS